LLLFFVLLFFVFFCFLGVSFGLVLVSFCFGFGCRQKGPSIIDGGCSLVLMVEPFEHLNI